TEGPGDPARRGGGLVSRQPAMSHNTVPSHGRRIGEMPRQSPATRETEPYETRPSPSLEGGFLSHNSAHNRQSSPRLGTTVERRALPNEAGIATLAAHARTHQLHVSAGVSERFHPIKMGNGGHSALAHHGAKTAITVNLDRFNRPQA